MNNEKHCKALIELMDEYMKDEMGVGQPMPKELAPKIIIGLKSHSAFLGFLVKMNGKYVALANCNLNYSTWQAMPLVNIHDFIVHSYYRKQGIGKFLLNGIKEFARENGYCKISLEVREDNLIAKKRYKDFGFSANKPGMLFWEMKVK